MTIELTQAQWLHEHGEVSWEELLDASGLAPELLRELVESGALAPINAQVPADIQPVQWRFTASCVVAVRRVSRLREDFDLDANALSVALMLVDRIHALEAQLRDLQSQLPRSRGR
ncbi:MAG: chaperone modulator CbpM [Burkholderiales bacterium]